MVTTTQTESRIVFRGRNSRSRILVVDREKEIRDILLPWLWRDGYDCREADDGQPAIDLLASGIRIDLVIFCLMMCPVDGLTLLLHVKRHYPRIPFAVVTAINDIRVRQEVFKSGADGYLLKPFTCEEFLTLVRRVLALPPRRTYPSFQ